MTRAEELALKAYPISTSYLSESNGDGDRNHPRRLAYVEGYEQAKKDTKEAIIKHFKYKQDHSPEHTMHWWVYKNVIDKVNEL